LVLVLLTVLNIYKLPHNLPVSMLTWSWN